MANAGAPIVDVAYLAELYEKLPLGLAMGEARTRPNHTLIR
jgi:hypothetical protein